MDSSVYKETDLSKRKTRKENAWEASAAMNFWKLSGTLGRSFVLLRVESYVENHDFLVLKDSVCILFFSGVLMYKT